MRSVFILLISFSALFLSAQSPQAFKYQASLRGSNGVPLIDKDVTVRISIIQGSTSGAPVYAEVHSVRTNSIGVVNLDIGKGRQPTSSFSEIPWGTDSYYIRVEIDPNGGTAFELIGISQLLSVPYALFANKSGDEKWRTARDGISYTTGNVGIGTENPSTKLEINGLSSPDVLRIRNENNSSGVNNIVSSNTDFHAPAFIGSRSRGSSLVPLSVQSGDRITGLYGRQFQNGVYQNSVAIQMYAGSLLTNSSYSSNIRFETTGINEVNRAERMRISESGNVGIGITDPAFKLDVAGQINATGFRINGQPLQLSSPWISQTGSIYYPSGNVGIGTSSPQSKLDVTGNGELDLLNLTNESNSLGITASTASSTDFHAPAYIGRRSRGTRLSPTSVTAGDRISGLYGSAFIDGAFRNAAGIQFYVGSNPGANNYPMNIRFETTSANQASRTERLRISETGNILVKTGDVFVETLGAGVVMKSPNGNCWRLTVDNSGAPVFSAVPCPQ